MTVELDQGELDDLILELACQNFCTQGEAYQMLRSAIENVSREYYDKLQEETNAEGEAIFGVKPSE